MGPAGASPPSVFSSKACLLAGLPLSNHERLLSGPLLQLREVLAEGSPGSGPVGAVMPEPVAPGDVAAAFYPRGIFASADATVSEECTAAPTVAEGSNEAKEGSDEAAGHNEAQTVAEGSGEAEEGGNGAAGMTGNFHHRQFLYI